jgi:hypothetical protein
MSAVKSLDIEIDLVYLAETSGMLPASTVVAIRTNSRSVVLKHLISERIECIWNFGKHPAIISKANVQQAD